MKRRWVWLTGGILVALLVALGVWYWSYWSGGPALPPFDPAGADPEAVALIEKVRAEVRARPRSGSAWGRLGMVLRAHGYGEEALVCFAVAEQLDPREPRWPYLRGLSLAQSDPTEGLACLRRAVGRWAGECPEAARLRLAEVLIEQGENEAGPLLDQAGPHPRAALLRARLAAAREDWGLVVRELAACAEDVHARKQAAALAAQAWRQQGEPDSAREARRRSEELPEDLPWPDPVVEEVEALQVGIQVRLAHADALVRQGHPEGLLLLEQLVEERPEHARAWLLLGRTLLRGRPAEAEVALARTVDLEPGSVEGWFQLAVARVFLGKREEAAKGFREATRLKPDYTLAYYNLGLCLKDLGDRSGARQAFEAALRSQPDHAESRRALDEIGRE
jgi:tetratricopeptide (TPR) repeat protein